MLASRYCCSVGLGLGSRYELRCRGDARYNTVEVLEHQHFLRVRVRVGNRLVRVGVRVRV